jgi:hypothetical protein
MTNLNSYSIQNYLYKVGSEYIFDKQTMKIESIIMVLDTVFFFCSKPDSQFYTKISATDRITSNIMPINALVFHNFVLKAVNTPTV